MLIEQCAYANRWRRKSSAAKGVFSLCGIVAAFAAAAPVNAFGVAAVMCAVTILGARIPPGRYLRVAAPAALFLAIGAMTLAVSLNFGGAAGVVSLHLEETALHRVAQVCGRSLGGLTALLFLALSTPMSDIIALLRRFRLPGLLLDIMTLCYRTFFVFSEVVSDTVTAQSARLGYATSKLAMRSLGILVANLTVQIWQRSEALHMAAMARNNDGPLRFLAHEDARPIRPVCLAAAAGITLIALARGVS